MAEVADIDVQAVTSSGPVVSVLQRPSIKLFPAVAADGVHHVTNVGPVSCLVQVVSVKLFAAFASAGAQLLDATAVGPVVTVLHVVALKLFSGEAATGVHDATGVLFVGDVQVMRTQLLPAVGAWAMHEATGRLV